MLKTRLTELFDLRYPIVSAPMAGHSGGRLAAAVTRAGGLGLFGGLGQTDWLREQIRYVRSETDRPFGVGFITAFLPRAQVNFETCLEERVPVLMFSFGDPTAYVKQTKAAGLTAICQVQTREGALLAVEAGADVLVAQGNEAGGHSGQLNTLPCLLLVREIAGQTPVIAAGGIATGASLAALLTAGAEGGLIGTTLMATPEAVEVPQSHKELIVRSDGQDTVHTRIYDVLGGAPWPAGIGGRVRENSVTREWHGREGELLERREEVRARIQDGLRQRDPDKDSLWMGQAAGLVKAIRPAGEIVREIGEEAERILRERPGAILGDQ